MKLDEVDYKLFFIAALQGEVSHQYRGSFNYQMVDRAEEIADLAFEKLKEKTIKNVDI